MIDPTMECVCIDGDGVPDLDCRYCRGTGEVPDPCEGCPSTCAAWCRETECTIFTGGLD